MRLSNTHVPGERNAWPGIQIENTGAGTSKAAESFVDEGEKGLGLLHDHKEFVYWNGLSLNAVEKLMNVRSTVEALAGHYQGQARAFGRPHMCTRAGTEGS